MTWRPPESLSARYLQATIGRRLEDMTFGLSAVWAKKAAKVTAKRAEKRAPGRPLRDLKSESLFPPRGGRVDDLHRTWSATTHN